MQLLKGIGLPEMLILLVIIVLVFGVGRVAKVAKDMGGIFTSFKDGLKSKDGADEKKTEELAQGKKN